MKRKNLLLGALCMVAFVLPGCAITPMMNRVDMHAVPNVSQAPDISVLITAKQNSRLLIAEGIHDSVSWASYVYDKAGKMHRLRAVNPAQKSNRLRLDIFCPSLNKDDIQYVVVWDRLGKVAYNSVGVGTDVKDWKKFNPVDSDYKDFFKVDPVNVKQVNRGSRDLLDLVAEYNLAFPLDLKDKISKALLKYNGEFESYNWNTPEWRIKQIVKEDSAMQALVDILLYEGWYAYASLPFIGVEESIFVAGLVKMFRIPSIFNDKVDLPGYATYKPIAMDVAEMVEIGFQIHGVTGDNRAMPQSQPQSQQTALTVQPGNLLLPEAFKAKIKGKLCSDVTTYEAYATCVGEYNDGVVKRNEARRAAKAAKK